MNGKVLPMFNCITVTFVFLMMQGVSCSLMIRNQNLGNYIRLFARSVLEPLHYSENGVELVDKNEGIQQGRGLTTLFCLYFVIDRNGVYSK